MVKKLAKIVGAILLLAGVLGFVLTLFGSTIGSLFSSILVDAPLSILALAVFAGIYRAMVPRGAGDVFD